MILLENPARRETPAEDHPLSWGQRALWMAERLAPGEAPYNLAAAGRVLGEIGAGALRRAFAVLTARHPALRTTFHEIAPGEPVQRVHGAMAPDVEVEEIAPEDLRQRLAEEAWRPFDLETGPPLRVRLFTGMPEGAVLLVAVHHLAADLASLSILGQELGALLKDEAADLPPVPAGPAEWAERQERLADERRGAWWREHLSGELPVLALPTDRPRPPILTYRGDSRVLRLGPETLDGLRAVSRAEGATLWAALLAGVGAWLSRITGQEELLLGSPVSLRGTGSFASALGYFVELTVLREDLSGRPSFAELLRRAKREAFSALRHAGYPFALLAEQLESARDPSRHPVVQVLLALQGAGLAAFALAEEGDRTPLGDLELAGVAVPERRLPFDLALLAAEAQGGLAISCQFNAALFDGPTVERLLAVLETLLAGMTADPGRPVAELPLLGEAERAQILRGWSGAGVEVSGDGDACLHDLVFAQARRTPQATAVVHGTERTTYEELARRAGELAATLREMGIAPEARVGVLLDRGPEMVVSVLGILAAGGVYVPLDPAHPEERRRMILEDAGISALVTRSGVEACGPGGVLARPSPRNLAYVLYTSGSTGRPKGVAVEHRSAVARVRWAGEVYPLEDLAGVLAATSLGFDLSVFELFVPLSHGGAVILADDALALPDLPARGEVTLINTVPSALAELLRAGSVPESVRTVNLAGEALPEALAGEVHRRLPGTRLWNLYGPTEDTTYSTFSEVRPGEAPLIGRPLEGTRVYVLDRGMQPLPAGVPGELFLGGAGQARGYLGRPDWTAERFVPDPFGPPGGRLYRTGDLVRFRADGALDFLGRIDHQVKVRGFRVELQEIEAALARHPAVEAAAVILREDRLAAYVVGEVEPEALRSWLRASLPGPMIPSAFVILPRLPLTPTGKVDRRALPTPSGAAAEEAVPANPTEEILAGIVADVLGVSRVGVRESFFDLGGHSLLAARVVSRVREALGVELPLRALFEEPTVAGLARRILKAEAPASPPLVPRPRPEALPLSFAQERLWFLWSLAPESPFYNMPAALRLTGPLSIPALAGTFGEIVRRHEALRTRFPVLAGSPVQEIDPPSPVPLPVVDLDGLPEAAREAERLSVAEARRPFDLTTGPVLRTTLLRLGKEEHLLLVTMHHAVSDGGSIAVLHRDFADLYPALAAGRPSPLAPLPVQYADFTLWQREQPFERELAWWRERLEGLPPGDLPSDRPRPAAQTFRGATLRRRIPAELRALSRRLGTTLFMTLLAGFEAVALRWTGREDAVTGSPVAGRDRLELDGVVGVFVNTLVLRTDLSGRPGFSGLARRVRETALGAWAHQALPFERLVEELAPERDLAFQPLFQRMFQLIEMPPEQVGLGDLVVERAEVEQGAATFDLALDLVDGPGGVTIQAVYATDLFDEATVGRFLGHFERLLAAAAADPERPVTELPILSEAELRELRSWSLGPEVPEGGSLLESFTAHVERTPDKVAVVFEGTALTYGELDCRSGRLARILSARGVGPERVVGVLLDRSPELIESLLGILKAGGAYLPMDSGTPRERLAYFVENAGASLVLTVSELAGKLPGVETILLDRLPSSPGEETSTVPLPQSLAYLIYTSGSTGRPKAVGVSYGVLSAHVRAMVRAYGVGPEDRILSFAAPGFDVSVEQILMALTAGAAVVLRPNELWEPAGLPRRLADLSVTVADLPPAYWNQLAVELEGKSAPEPRPRLVAAGGDVMQAGPLRRWMRGPWAGVRLFNVYGPTETTITSTAADVTGRGPTPWERVPIGRPLPGRTHFVLDPEGNPVPQGVPGEVCVGGPLLARGYLGRPDLTALRFVPDPWSAGPGGRLYRTGDLARYLPDGELEFAGRTDTQIKIRGFRIEPGEIEAALASHPAVRQAVAVAREDRPGDRRLAAYVTLDADRPETPKIVPLLRALCEERLPAWMVPPDLVVLDALPVTIRGKVDLRALPAPERPEPAAVLPRSPEERALASLWSELLGLDRLGVHDNFFALGGHSLLATQVVSRVRQAFAVELPLRHVFEAPTVAGLAVRLQSALATAGRLALPPVEPVPREGDLPLSFGQQRLWFLNRMAPDAPGYLMAGAFRLEGGLSVSRLASALSEVVRRHEVLRSTYHEGPVQRIHPPRRVFLPVVDLSGLADGEREVRRLAREEAGRPFDLERDLMVRGTLLRLGEREHVALLTLHHIASDGWSVDVLVRELAALHEDALLPGLPIQYGDFAVWQRRWLDGPVLEGQLAWWKDRLAGAPPLLELPTDRPRPPVRTGRGGRRAFAVAPDLAAALQDLATREGTTLFVLLLAVWEALLGRITHQEDLLVGTPVAGRRQAETEALIGFFVNTLVLRADLAGDPAFRDFLARVHTGALDALSHQDLPFERLVEELNPGRSLARTPVFQVTFALQHASGVPLELPGLTLRQLPFEPEAKFDLELALAETEEGLAGTLDYAADLFDPATAERLAGLYGNLLGEIAAAPGRRLSDLDPLSEAERQQLVEWGSGAALTAEGTVLDLFDAQVERAPEAVAVIAGDISLTYSELAQRSDDVARRLADRVRPGDVVGLRVERNADLAVGILGIWKAGAVFLPLDPSYPTERVDLMIRDSRCACVVGAQFIAPPIAALPVPSAKTSDVSVGGAVGGAMNCAPTTFAEGFRPGAGEVAYLLYTSGTTGTPKAVMVEHGSLLHTLQATASVFGFEAGGRMPSVAPFSFDIFLFELLSPLLSGGTAVILASPDLLLEELPRSTRFHAVPAVLRQVVDRAGPSERYSQLQEIYTGGDAVPAGLLGEARKAFPSARLRVLYGPTEGTIVCSFHRVGTEARPLLGRPFPGVSLRLLDPRGNPVPVGVPGEIHIGGAGVARGYLGRPDLTSERFVPAPGGARLYRTSDLARFRPDGSLEFLGRADSQVKVRGVRIEPGEVEARLASHPGVRQAAVVAREEPGGRILAAFYVPAPEAPEDGELRSFLARGLPEAMIPSRFVALEALPLTANAKVDRGALARMELSTPEASAAPRTPTEEILAGLFAEALGVERVGVRDDFFALGGHSLLATRVVSRVREALGVELPLPVLFEEPTVAGLAGRIGVFSGAILPPVRPIPRDGDLPLSFAQQRLWFLDQMEPGTPLYNMPALLRLAGPLDVAALAAAFGEVVRRHEALRTTFPARRGAPRQEIHPFLSIPLPVVDLAGLPEEARRLGIEETRRPFDLAAGPLLRALLFRVEREEHVLAVTMHHIVSDGWSMGILIRELAALYAGNPLPPLPVQYADFAVWQREWFAGGVLDEQLSWWRERLAGVPLVLEVPADRPRPPVRSPRGTEAVFEVPETGLAALGRRSGATLFMTLFAGFQALLHRITGQDAFLAGTPVAGRRRPEIEGLIGFFVNTLPLRADLSGRPTVLSLLGRVREDALGAWAHQDLPFERLVEELDPVRDPSRTPLVQILFALQDFPGTVTLPGLAIDPLPVPGDTAKMDLTVTLTPRDGILAGTVEYATDLFDRATVLRLAERFGRLLAGMAADPGRTIDALPILSEAERRQLLDWGGTPGAAQERTIPELFEEQAARTPDLPAISWEGGRLTYAELRRRARRLAARLGVLEPEARVAVLSGRSPELVTALLAILYAGGVYVPLDPEYPAERRAFLLRDSGARVLLTGRDLQPDGDEPPDADNITPAPVSPESLAYVIYTSGSTGQPKGVAVPHRAVVRLVRNTDYVRLGPGDRVAQASNASFDAATFEIWGALLNGAELVGLDREATFSPARLTAALRESRIDSLFLTTALFNRIAAETPGAFAPVRDLLFGGEAVDPGAVRRVLEHGAPCRLLHVYGPTENTTFSTWHPVAGVPPGAATVPIGGPIAQTTVHLLDRELRPVPVGSPGEVCLGGDGLARGYLGRPDLTAAAFVPDPEGVGERLYATGDLARWRPDGAIEFLGRRDGQVKIRGFRIEPGEIEAVLATHPAVRQAAVLVREDRTGDRRLAAFVEGAPRDTAGLRAFLKDRLPGFMIPSAFVWVDSIPLNANGKVDRRALAVLPVEPEAREGLAPPRTPVEEGIAAIWSEVLGAGAVSRDDDFFERGGHSLLATQVASRLRETFAVELPIRDLFAFPRLADLAARVEEERRAGAGLAAPPILPVPRPPEGLPLSFGQEWMWLVDQLDPEAAAYNAPMPVRLEGELDVMALEAALRATAARHEILRTVFTPGPLQRVREEAEVPFTLVDLSALPPDRREAEAVREAIAEARRPFDLAARPPIRALLLRLAPADHRLVLDLHHIVTDGWSAGVLLREVATHYVGKGLASLPIQYGDFAVWQRNWLSGETLERLLDHWRERLAGPLPILELPADRPRAAAAGALGERLPFVLSPEEADAFRRLARRRGATLFAVLLAGFEALLHRIAHQDDLLVGTPVAGRTRRETEDLIGYFVNNLVLRTDLGGDPLFADLVDRVQETALDAWSHQDLPLLTLVQALHPERARAGAMPLFQAWFQLQNTPVPAIGLPGLALAPWEIETPAATFDVELLTMEAEGELRGHLVVNRGLFRRETAERLLGWLLTLLKGAAAAPERRLSELPLLSGEELAQILQEAGPAAAFPDVLPLHRAFEARAAEAPDAPAVTFEGETLSYAELDRRANRLAWHLRALGVGPEVRVGLAFPRSLDLIVAILGILKAGGAYVPLDPDYPRERLDFLAADAGLRVLLTPEDLPETGPETPPGVDVNPDALAYVIYTSGSTGRPKGVMVTHRQAARLFAASASFGFGPGDVWTLFHSYAFDFSVWEIWGALLHGGRLVVVPRWVARSPEAFRDLLVREGVTVLNQTPSAFYQLLQVDEGNLRLRWVIFGGEALEPAKLRPWLDRHGDRQPVLVNMFGITETTVHVTLRPLTRADLDAGSVIGRPLPDLSLHLLDRGLQPVPPGVVGEIFVGGAGVARGYHGRPELTAERFLPDPFSAGRLYRSGDLAHRAPNGEIEYLGRADQQLKVRGFRIEPGEIESALVRHPAVREAAVLARRVSDEDIRLVAFLAGRELPPAEELRNLLLETLPEHMVPAAFIPLPALPLTPHGKVDRRALAALEETEAPRAAAEAPANPLEERLAALWAELLEVDSVSRDESFFALGGHSLLMTRVATRVREELGVSIPMKSFFDRPTVAGLAETIRANPHPLSPSPISRPSTPGEGGPLPVVLPSAGKTTRMRSPSPGGGWKGDGRGGQGVRIHTIAFPTANRPDVLARGLMSYAATAPHRRFLVMDDSKDPGVRAEYRQRLTDLRERLGVTVLYAGLEEKRRFAADLAAEAGVDPAVTEAALLDPLGIGLTVGANRNAVLLATVGEGVLSVDDDTLSLVAPSPGQEEGTDVVSGTVPGTAFLSGRDPGEIRAFAGRAEALASLDLRPADLAGLHEGMLGQPVLVTTNGWAGDCGWHSPSFYMLLEGESRRRLVRTAEGYRTATASKEIVRSVPRTTLGDGDSFMATLFTGLDNRRLLPPFPPVLWGEDLLFGITLQLCFSEARVGHLPWVAAHEPVEVRRFWPGEMARSASGVDHSRLVSALLDGFSPDSAEPVDALKKLGRYFLELGRMTPADFDALALRSVRARAEAFAVELEARLTAFDLGEGEGAALWAADVRRYLDLLQKHAAEPDFGVPLDLLYGRDAEEARRLAQRLIANYGLVLFHWPELVEAARRLKDQGRGLAEEVRGASVVSFGQERLWLQDRLSPGSAAYNTANALRLTGRLDVPLLERCFAEIARRHEVLRATFAEQGGTPVQVVHPPSPVELPVTDLSALPEEIRAAELSRLTNEEFLSPFDLVRGPLHRVRLVRLGAEEHVLLLTLHHIISDAWSMGVITRELAALHAASPLPPLPIRYADYARRQREWMAGPELPEQLAWWRERLAGAPEALEIPTDRPRPAVRRFRGGMRTVRLPADLAQAVRALCRERQVTLFMALLSVFEILLHARTGENDLVVGVDVAGRTSPETEALVGFFINQLVLRVDLAGDPTVSQILDRVRETALEAFARQDLPFGRLVEELAPKRSLARNPLFQVMFGLYNVPGADLDLGGIAVSPVDIEGGAAVFDLSLYMAEAGDGLLGTLRYDADLFEAATIDRLLEDYETLLRRAVQAPEERVSVLLVHLAAERRRRIEAERESLSKARLKTLKTVRRRPHE